MNGPIKIAMCRPPSRMLREIVEELCAAEPDLELVPEPHEHDDLATVVEQTGAECVISRDGALTTAEICRVLIAHPSVRLLAMAEDGHGTLYELRPHRVPLGEASPLTVLETIRAAVPAQLAVEATA